MPTRIERRSVPYSAGQVFALVADVERFPDFVPMVREVRIRWRHGNSMDVDMLLGFGPVHYRILSHAELSPPRRIDIHSTDIPFEHFDLSWRFDPLPGGGTRVELAGSFALHSALVESLVDIYADKMIPRMADAFEARARALYGAQTG